MAELDRKIDAAANHSFFSMNDLVTYIHKEKLRRSDLVCEYGAHLLNQYASRVGDDVWSLYEQTFIASLDTNDEQLANVCLKALMTKFPESLRVKRLLGMQLEQRNEYEKAEKVYADILEENPANALALKRQVCILKSQGKMNSAINQLNLLLKNFPMDQSSWQMLADLHLSRNCFRQAAFCYEELVLLEPLNFWFHSRLAEIYITIGGFDHLKAARKHLAQSLDFNSRNNLRAYMSLLLVTSTLQAMKPLTQDPEEMAFNHRLYTLAHKAIHSYYDAHAIPEVNDIAIMALKQLEFTML